MELKKFKLKKKKQTFIIIFSIFIGLILGYFLFGNSYAFILFIVRSACTEPVNQIFSSCYAFRRFWA